MENNSKSITDYNLLSRDKIFEIISRYDLKSQKPLSDNLNLIKDEIIGMGYEELIIDAFCGIGESTYKIAKANPDQLVIGFDKSLSRIERKNKFKKESVKNLLIFQADIFDIYQVFFEIKKINRLRIIKQFIMYPNPWPKLKNKKKRVYLNNVIPYIFAQESEIEVRSNWGRFLVEFSMVAEFYNFNFSFEKLEGKPFMTPFEKKYYLSGQSLNKLILKPL